MYTQEYLDYLDSDEWHQKRLKKAEQVNYTCELCGKIVVSGFQVHHRTYRNLFHEPLCDLQFLCEECHQKQHEKKAMKRRRKAKKS